MQKMFQKRFPGPDTPDRSRGEQVYCALCGGELYPGDVYFWTDRGRVCEACLEPYAQDYFAPDRRRLCRREREEP